jgi:hypothetical protein
VAFNPPRKNVSFTFAVALPDMANPGKFKVSPTIAAGDAKVDIDGAGFNNLATLPDVQPAASRRVRVQLSAGEMNGDVITVQCVDQTSPAEWAEVIVVIDTAT